MQPSDANQAFINCSRPGAVAITNRWNERVWYYSHPPAQLGWKENSVLSAQDYYSVCAPVAPPPHPRPCRFNSSCAWIALFHDNNFHSQSHRSNYGENIRLIDETYDHIGPASSQGSPENTSALYVILNSREKSGRLGDKIERNVFDATVKIVKRRLGAVVVGQNSHGSASRRPLLRQNHQCMLSTAAADGRHNEGHAQIVGCPRHHS